MPPTKIKLKDLKKETLENSPRAIKVSKKPLSNTPYSLPEFLRWLNTKAKLSMSDSMQIAAKLVPAKLNSDNALYQLTDSTLRKFIQNEDHRRAILNATFKLSSSKNTKMKSLKNPDIEVIKTTLSRSIATGEFIYNEIFDPIILSKIVIETNRAPVMTAWATTVIERMGFSRPEALSLSSVYTSLNAHAKAASLFIQEKKSISDIGPGPNQPKILIMGRNVPCILLREPNEWRGIDDGQPISPTQPYQYLVNNFKSQLGKVMGAMKLLVDDIVIRYSSEERGLRELKEGKIGYACYLDFRPDVPLGEKGWGAKGILNLNDILLCRKINNNLYNSEKMGNKVNNEIHSNEIKSNLEKNNNEDIKFSDNDVQLDTEDEALFEDIPGIENIDV